ncbi:tRNA lysidine(34) synthetase TilS [Planctobacterium marinum]|uniref:tRNA(Ile)-lysidine synthase n=1 Tax=Planctobacterium marinum TaxID=1631968 RepID=A0AA48KSW4_9ALTE|nr:tRNA(Ile)-lysidine synthase [Planctobacterium marinum]
MNPGDNNTIDHLTRHFDAITGAYFNSDNTEVSEILVAYSGGVDSTVLLVLAAEFAGNNQIPVSAIHVNHNLSANAGQWQQHCIQTCEHLQVPLTVKCVAVDTKGKGVEAAAREARYAAIAEVASEHCLVLLGQHQNDQVETFLIQLLRGAGPEGLSGMAQNSVNQYGTRLLRPLLHATRGEVEQYARQQGLSWVEDESNDNSDYDRNFLRNQVLPLIKQRWPEMGKTISRSMSHIQEQNGLLRESVVNKFQRLSTARGCLNVKELKRLSLPWQKQVLKHWISLKEAGQPSQNVLKRIIDDCMNAREDAQPVVKWGQWQCCRYDNELYLFGQSQAIPEGQWLLKINTQGESNIALPADAGVISLRQPDSLTLENVVYLPDGAEVLVTFGGFSRRFRPRDSKISKPINQWFKEWRVAPWLRQKTPILQFRDEILAVGDRVAKQFESQHLTAFELKWETDD